MTSLHHPQLHRSLNQNKENAFAHPSKTPARPTGLGKAGPSTIGPKSVNGKMMMGMGGPSTVHRDGKGKEGRETAPSTDIGPKRLFTQHLPSTSLKASKSSNTLSLTQAPATTRKVAPSTLLSQAKTPYSSKILTVQRTPAPSTSAAAMTPLPSASRVRRRSRQSFTPVKQITPPGQIKAQSFLTPQRGGSEYGDESFGMEEDGGELLGGMSKSASLEGLVEEEESDGEPEYMPPKVIPLEHDAPFEIPDLKALGKLAKQSGFFGRWDEEDGEVVLASIEMTEEEVIQGGWQEGGYVADFKVGKSEEDPIFAYLDAKKALKSVQSRAPTAATTGTNRSGPSSLKTPASASRFAPSSRTGLPSGSSALQAKPRFSGSGLPPMRSADSAFSLLHQQGTPAGRMKSGSLTSRGGIRSGQLKGNGKTTFAGSIGQRSALGPTQTPLGNKTNHGAGSNAGKKASAVPAKKVEDLGWGSKLDFKALEKELGDLSLGGGEDYLLDVDFDFGEEKQ